MTQSQREALQWLRDHHGDGVIDRQGCILAAGERAPFQRVTWTRLEALGHVEFYGLDGRRRRRRIRLTDAGRIAA